MNEPQGDQEPREPGRQFDLEGWVEGLARAVVAGVERQTSAQGLTAIEFTVMRVFTEHPECTFEELGEALPLEREQLGVLVQSLIQRGLLHEIDRETRSGLPLLALTQSGRERVWRLHIGVQEEGSRLLAGVSPEQMETLARKRGSQFRSKEAFVELLGFSPNFRKVAPGVLELMADTTLRKTPEGDAYELICPKEYEAQMIEYARIFAVLVDFATIACPVKAYGADPTLPYAYLPTLDLGDIRNVHYDFLPDASHFLQLEYPDVCAATLREFLADVGYL